MGVGTSAGMSGGTGSVCDCRAASSGGSGADSVSGLGEVGTWSGMRAIQMGGRMASSLPQVTHGADSGRVTASPEVTLRTDWKSRLFGNWLLWDWQRNTFGVWGDLRNGRSFGPVVGFPRRTPRGIYQ